MVYGDATVEDDARVLDKATMYYEALIVTDAQAGYQSKVFEKAWVMGFSLVFSQAQVCGHAQIFGHAKIGGHTKIVSRSVPPFVRSNPDDYDEKSSNLHVRRMLKNKRTDYVPPNLKLWRRHS